MTDAYAVHLVKRFFGFVLARPLSPREQAEVTGLLEPVERALFWDQPVADQRHGLLVARRLLLARPGDREAARAALLHDVGKRHCGLGAIGRSVATMLQILRLPAPGRFGAYLDHGRIGADELEALGSSALVVHFAAAHPGPAPPGFDSARWDALNAADYDTKAPAAPTARNTMTET